MKVSRKKSGYSYIYTHIYSIENCNSKAALNTVFDYFAYPILFLIGEKPSHEQEGLLIGSEQFLLPCWWPELRLPFHHYWPIAVFQRTHSAFPFVLQFTTPLPINIEPNPPCLPNGPLPTAIPHGPLPATLPSTDKTWFHNSHVVHIGASLELLKHWNNLPGAFLFMLTKALCGRADCRDSQPNHNANSGRKQSLTFY